MFIVFSLSSIWSLSIELSSWKNGSLKETFKLSSAYRQGLSVSYASQSSQCPKVSGGVMGNANETQVSVNYSNDTTRYWFMC